MGIFAGIKAARIADDDRPDRKIRAMKTVYKGTKFRSRTEARWAVFFEALGQPWQYEPGWVKLPHGKHLPDFYLPNLGIYVQIKGMAPDEKALLQARELSALQGCSVYIVHGRPNREEQKANGGALCFYGGKDYSTGWEWTRIACADPDVLEGAWVAAAEAKFTEAEASPAAAPALKNYIVRKNCEYSMQVLAADEDAAMEIAAKRSADDWTEAWSPWEAEEDG